MRIVRLLEPVAPNGDGFYEVGPDGFGDGPFNGEEARARYALLLVDGVVEVWRHDPPALRAAEDEAHLMGLMDEAETEAGPADPDPGARAALAARISAATASPPTDRPSGPSL